MKNIVLSFDDGRLDFYTLVFPLLKKYNIKATLNITTGYSDGTCPAPFKCCSIDNLKEMKESHLIELAMHGDKHLQNETLEDFEVCYAKFYSFCLSPQNAPIGIAMPYNQYPNNELLKWAKNHNIRYIRIGTYSIRKSPSLFLMHLRKKDDFQKKAIISSKHNKNKSIYLYSVPIEINKTCDDYIRIIQNMKKNNTIILMFHSIFRDDKVNNIHFKNGAWPLSELELLFAYINNNREINNIFQMEVKDLSF